MNTGELSRCLAQDSFVNKQFFGVFPADKLPPAGSGTEQSSGKPRRMLIITNSQKSGLPGAHWCAWDIDGRVAEFFDSYGQRPNAVPAFKRYATQFRTVTYNKKRIQSSLSTICGQLCVAYLQHKARGVGMEAFVDHFAGRNPVLTEETLNQMINETFETNFPLTDVSFLQDTLGTGL